LIFEILIFMDGGALKMLGVSHTPKCEP